MTALLCFGAIFGSASSIVAGLESCVVPTKHGRFLCCLLGINAFALTLVSALALLARQ